MKNNQEAFQYFLEHYDLVDHLCEPIKEFGVKSFGYVMVYNDGSYVGLSNADKEHEKKFFQKIKNIDPYTFTNITECTIGAPRIMLWPTDYRSNEVYSMMYEYNIWNGISILIRNKRYIEIISFASDRNNLHLANHVVNNIRLYLEFIKDFKHKVKEIIKNWEESKYAYFYNDGLKKLYTSEQRNVSIISSLTSREAECCAYLVKGYSSKEIARILNISHRTVESHVEHIKNKLNITNKSEIIKKYAESELIL